MLIIFVVPIFSVIVRKAKNCRAHTITVFFSDVRVNLVRGAFAYKSLHLIFEQFNRNKPR